MYLKITAWVEFRQNPQTHKHFQLFEGVKPEALALGFPAASRCLSPCATFSKFTFNSG